ncbi:Protein of unknown function [Pseudidiomarina planktonica]|uniref:DUF1778 domain-containing protein n=1 Tax=Pseudidiomarina planktonica TaxID=1323738 RepID=A0A1Y6E9P9_9GAMM|nr:DUF1778 domain-containing protein [Pseudidiomarina planktonica]SMQ59325.1 Protein of unknown function [Pseudidiomarina planktonica]
MDKVNKQEEAENRLPQPRVMKLNPHAWKKLLQSLDTPPEPTKSLVDLMKDK